MKLLNSSVLFVLCSSMHVSAMQQETINKSDLYGSWNCKHQIEDANTNINVKIDYNVNFKAAGKSSGIGSLLFTVQNFPELEYHLSDVSTWDITGNTLILSSTQIKSVNVSHPELDKLLNLNKLIPNKVDESAEILTLTKNRLMVKYHFNEQVITCSKNRI